LIPEDLRDRVNGAKWESVSVPRGAGWLEAQVHDVF
jgi:hypothetical protein